MNLKGLICPRCECRDFEVEHTRPHRDGHIARTRRCLFCGLRVATAERIEPVENGTNAARGDGMQERCREN